jgi:hypothetical protein
MDWIKKTRTLLKELEGTRHPGSRIKLIRSAKNRSGDSKGKFGERDFIKRLVEEGAINASDSDRRTCKRFESGEIVLKPGQEPVPTILRLLEVTPEFAGYIKKSGTEQDSSECADSSKAAKKVNLARKKLKLTAYNHLECQALSLLITHDPSTGIVEMHVFGNEKPDQKVLPERFSKDFEIKEIWLREQLVKFADSKDSRIVMPGKGKVEL